MDVLSVQAPGGASYGSWFVLFLLFFGAGLVVSFISDKIG